MKTHRRWYLACWLVAAIVGGPALRADVRLAGIFGDHMVLQRDMPLRIWGWADPGEQVSLSMDRGPFVTATADEAGKWNVVLPAMKAGGPHVLTVKGKNSLRLEDVLIGEVWLCSGQSNMEFTVAGAINAAKEIASASHPTIRHIKVPRRPAGYPADDIQAPWQVCSPETAGGFTAAGYFFARELVRELNVPVGLVHASWGGTRIEPWTPPEGFASVEAVQDIYRKVRLTMPGTPEYRAALQKYIEQTAAWLATAREALAAKRAVAPSPAFPDGLKPLTQVQSPCALYNGMIHPLVGLPLRGALWYQGESNHVEGMLYTEKTKALVGGWRKLWGIGDFPFYYVQIAPYRYGNEPPSIIPRFWEAQIAALSIPNTGMAVTTDIGNLDNIHPRNKQEAGRRLALLALAKTYGKDVVCMGPTFKSFSVEGSRLRVTFDHADGGLASRDGKPLTWFEIIGEDTDFVTATAKIDGNSVVLSAPEVRKPVAVRFAWHRNAEPNLANGKGLPAWTFRAGNVPRRDYLKLKVPEAAGYELVYELDLAKLGRSVRYAVDRRGEIQGGFDRVAYFLELQKDNGPVRYIYVSMDAFTGDLSKIGIPTVASGASFQQGVRHLNVISNVKGIQGGTGLNGGNIEFWPNNYGPANSAKVPGASSSTYDFGDQPSDPRDGYGCMQVHRHAARQTLFAINHWTTGSAADLGIGNSRGKSADWTFTGNAGSYSVKKLRVLVRKK